MKLTWFILIYQRHLIRFHINCCYPNFSHTESQDLYYNGSFVWQTAACRLGWCLFWLVTRIIWCSSRLHTRSTALSRLCQWYARLCTRWFQTCPLRWWLEAVQIKVIKSEPCKESLQDDIDCIHRWSVDSQMSFNASKCKVVNMSKKEPKPLITSTILVIKPFNMQLKQKTKVLLCQGT